MLRLVISIVDRQIFIAIICATVNKNKCGNNPGFRVNI